MDTILRWQKGKRLFGQRDLRRFKSYVNVTLLISFFVCLYALFSLVHKRFFSSSKLYGLNVDPALLACPWYQDLWSPLTTLSLVMVFILCASLKQQFFVCRSRLRTEKKIHLTGRHEKSCKIFERLVDTLNAEKDFEEINTEIKKFSKSIKKIVTETGNSYTKSTKWPPNLTSAQHNHNSTNFECYPDVTRTNSRQTTDVFLNSFELKLNDDKHYYIPKTQLDGLDRNNDNVFIDSVKFDNFFQDKATQFNGIITKQSFVDKQTQTDIGYFDVRDSSTETDVSFRFHQLRQPPSMSFLQTEKDKLTNVVIPGTSLFSQRPKQKPPKKELLSKWKKSLCSYEEKLSKLKKHVKSKDELFGSTFIIVSRNKEELKQSAMLVRTSKERLENQKQANNKLSEDVENKASILNSLSNLINPEVSYAS